MSADVDHSINLAHSPFQEYLHTNYIPTDSEIPRIDAHLKPHEAELGRLDSLIQDLTERRSRVKAYIESHRALLSLPRRLPQDVLEGIFAACLPLERNPTMSAAQVPLLLGRICSTWRTVAFSMPKLWAALHVSLAFIASRTVRKVAMLDWLERSAPLPLNLSMWFTPDIPGCHHIFHLLLRFSLRWGALSISNITHEDFQKMAQIKSPLLEDLKVAYLNVNDWRGLEVADNANADGLDAEKGSTILSGPLFRGMKKASVGFALRDLNVLVPATPFSWDHLEHLTLVLRVDRQSSQVFSLTTTNVFRLLQGCKNLCSFRVSLAVLELPDAWITEVIVLPSLASLVLIIDGMVIPAEGVTESAYFVNFMEHLIIPHLDIFRVLHSEWMALEVGLMIGMPVLTHLATHSPSLSQLCIPLSTIATATSLQTLRLFSCLTRLELRFGIPRENPLMGGDIETNDTLVVSLGPDTDMPNPFPALRELCIRCLIQDEIWVNLAENQLKYHTKLQDLHIYNGVERPNVVLDVGNFRARGLNVWVEYTVPRRKQLPSSGLTVWSGFEDKCFIVPASWDPWL
ncbi:hypothetical protein R3P38DRAFT_3236922 [Favolaschia claudopus]|uniref:F-box domain-containing protein n=1 Tax=Favolaschia claudopus TaxID=2862362 RepID=A0AAV9ZCU8_9AGAR